MPPPPPISFPSVVFSIADGGDDSPRGSASSDHVLIGHEEKVTLLHGEFLVVHHSRDLLHELHHLFVPLCLLRIFAMYTFSSQAVGEDATPLLIVFDNKLILDLGWERNRHTERENVYGSGDVGVGIRSRTLLGFFFLVLLLSFVCLYGLILVSMVSDSLQIYTKLVRINRI